MSNNTMIEQKETMIEDSESIASDESEEMTELDEDEFDLRRAECVADMKEIEAQFVKLKEELIKERFVIIDQKAKEIEEETAEEFIAPLNKLKFNQELKIKLSTLTLEYKMKDINHIHECELASHKLTFENNKQSIFDKIKENIEKEIQQLEENHRRFKLDYEYYLLCKNSLKSGEEEAESEKNFVEEETAENNRESTTETMIDEDTYNKPRHNNHKITAPVILTGTPFMVYSLHDYEILEDLSIIKMHENIGRSVSVSTEC